MSCSEPRLGGRAGFLNLGIVGGVVLVAFCLLGDTYDQKLSDSLLRSAIVSGDVAQPVGYGVEVVAGV